MALIDKVKNKPNSNAQVEAENNEFEAPEENTTPAVETPEFDGDISLDVVRKKRFRIDGDNNRILELNTSDLTVINRLEKLYPELQKLSQDAAVKQLEDSDTDIEVASKALVQIDMKMREMMDTIFDSNVSEICAPSGSMFDPFNGEFRFEHIIDIIGNLYTSNIAEEAKKISKRMKKHIAKYTKGK